MAKTVNTLRNTQNRETKVLSAVLACAVVVLLVGLFSLTSNLALASESQDIEASAQESSSGLASEAEPFDNQDLISAQTNQAGSSSQTTIYDNAVPLSNVADLNQLAGHARDGSYFNTVVAALCLIMLIVSLILLSTKKDYKVIVVRTIAAAIGVATLAVWSLLDTLQAPAVLFNEASPLIATLFALYVATILASYVYENRLKRASAKK